jgi:hypothetical protein
MSFEKVMLVIACICCLSTGTIILSCAPTDRKNSEKVPVENTNYTYDGVPIETVVYDSCEYVRFSLGHYQWGSHKGNCKFCQERLRKLIKEIKL